MIRAGLEKRGITTSEEMVLKIFDESSVSVGTFTSLSTFFSDVGNECIVKYSHILSTKNNSVHVFALFMFEILTNC